MSDFRIADDDAVAGALPDFGEFGLGVVGFDVDEFAAAVAAAVPYHIVRVAAGDEIGGAIEVGEDPTREIVVVEGGGEAAIGPEGWLRGKKINVVVPKRPGSERG